MAEMIQADWEKVGVKTKLITYEWAEYRKRSKTGEQSVMMFGWSGDNGDPDNSSCRSWAARRSGRRQRRALVQQGLRGPDHQGGADPEAGGPRQALRAGAGDLQGRSAVDHGRALDPVRPGAQ
jgi:ABC-type transport system substrate-binding protein